MHLSVLYSIFNILLELEQELLNELGDEVGGRGTGISRGGEDSQSLGGTSVSASAVSRDRDSKLASILAVAQSSSHENVVRNPS